MQQFSKRIAHITNALPPLERFFLPENVSPLLFLTLVPSCSGSYQFPAVAALRLISRSISLEFWEPLNPHDKKSCRGGGCCRRLTGFSCFLTHETYGVNIYTRGGMKMWQDANSCSCFEAWLIGLYVFFGWRCVDCYLFFIVVCFTNECVLAVIYRICL